MNARNVASGNMKSDDGVLSDAMSIWLNKQVEELDDRPRRLFDVSRFNHNADITKRVVRDLTSSLGSGFNVSYSVKTNPSADVLGLALAGGLGAECISLAELAAVQRLGFGGSACTLNGPGKWWPREFLGRVDEPMAVNCDSVEDLRKTLAMLDELGWNSCILGVRVAAPGTQSRFGVDLGDPQTVAALCAALEGVSKSRCLGVHFHYAQSVLGTSAWLETAKAAVRQASVVFRSASREVEHLDFGGGWRTRDFDGFAKGLAGVCGEASERFGHLRSFQIEPGKMLVEDCGFVACRVLGRRGTGGDASVVVSAALSDVPDVVSFSHGVVWRKAKGGPWRALGKGHGCVLGRLCMESDVLRRNVAVPSKIHEGDIVVICDTGAYDSSMAFSFGEGALGAR